jgi:hypothetical protein
MLIGRVQMLQSFCHLVAGVLDSVVGFRLMAYNIWGLELRMLRFGACRYVFTRRLKRRCDDAWGQRVGD